MQVMPVDRLATIGENKIAAAEVANLLMGNGGKIFISVLIMVSTFGALNACIIVYPRLYYRMAQEKFFFKNMANVHPIFRTPYVALVVSMLWSSILVVTGTFDQLTNLVIFSAYIFLCHRSIGGNQNETKGFNKNKTDWLSLHGPDFYISCNCAQYQHCDCSAQAIAHGRNTGFKRCGVLLFF